MGWENDNPISGDVGQNCLFGSSPGRFGAKQRPADEPAGAFLVILLFLIFLFFLFLDLATLGLRLLNDLVLLLRRNEVVVMHFHAETAAALGHGG